MTTSTAAFSRRPLAMAWLEMLHHITADTLRRVDANLDVIGANLRSIEDAWRAAKTELGPQW